MATDLLDKFGPPIAEFQLQVPSDYDHGTMLARLKKAVKKVSFYFHLYLTDENYPNPTHRLNPGEIYTVKVFPILEKVWVTECLIFMRYEKALLVGAQGLALVCELERDRLPIAKYLGSPDEDKALWKDFTGISRVPFVERLSNGKLMFMLSSVEYYLTSDDCILCFYKSK